MQTSTTDHISRFLAALALGIVAWVLVLSAGYYSQPFFARATAAPDAGLPELERLACIERAVEEMTSPGEDVRLLVQNDDEYLKQRVTELVYPRINLVSDPEARVVVVSAPASSSADTRVCGDVGISVERGA